MKYKYIYHIYLPSYPSYWRHFHQLRQHMGQHNIPSGEIISFIPPEEWTRKETQPVSERSQLDVI